MGYYTDETMEDRKDERIERLEAENARLREALEEAQIIFAPDQKGRYAMLTASLCERGHKLCTAAIREGE